MGFVQTDADLRSLITGARDIIYACDASGHFTYANPFAVELMGYPEEDILGIAHQLDGERVGVREVARRVARINDVARAGNEAAEVGVGLNEAHSPESI